LQDNKYKFLNLSLKLRNFKHPLVLIFNQTLLGPFYNALTLKLLPKTLLKALTDHLVGGVREYTYSIRICKLEARKIFISHFKWPSSQDQQKTIVHRLITSKVTLTGQSHFTLIFVLRKATLPNRINSVP
jgi:hypothetical protein